MSGTASVVNEDVDGRFRELCESFGDRIAVADVERDGVAGDPLLRKRCGEILNRWATIDRDDMGAFRAEMPAESLANPAGGAGNGDSLSRKHHAAHSIAARPSAIQSTLASRKWPQL